ncbi:hypothetical protein [Streptomyces lacrimifluminis]|uniref:hypothetical protein n=1 Tax=Streptomyces lacrimifluminis TaxID=1500077 RepID=UPI001E3E0107|nr:hypothetical protein [Streptomyces lacrimifluminis]
MTRGGSGIRISCDKTVHRESVTFRTRSIRAPPLPASSTPAASTTRCSNGVRR